MKSIAIGFLRGIPIARETSLSIKYLSFSMELGIRGEWCYATSPSCAYRSFHLSPARERKREDDRCGRKRKGWTDGRVAADIPTDRNRSANATGPLRNLKRKKRGRTPARLVQVNTRTEILYRNIYRVEWLIVLTVKRTYDAMSVSSRDCSLHFRHNAKRHSII